MAAPANQEDISYDVISASPMILNFQDSRIVGKNISVGSKLWSFIL